MTNKTPYNEIDHAHCWTTDDPPCGIKGRHRCCLCKKDVPATQQAQEKALAGYFVTHKGILRMETIVIDGKQYYKNVGLEDLATLIADTEKRVRVEAIEEGRLSVLKDFESLCKADAFLGFSNDEWKAVQKFFAVNKEISEWDKTPKQK